MLCLGVIGVIEGSVVYMQLCCSGKKERKEYALVASGVVGRLG